MEEDCASGCGSSRPGPHCAGCIGDHEAAGRRGRQLTPAPALDSRRRGEVLQPPTLAPGSDRDPEDPEPLAEAASLPTPPTLALQRQPLPPPAGPLLLVRLALARYALWPRPRAAVLRLRPSSREHLSPGGG